MSSQSFAFDPATLTISWTGGSYSVSVLYGGFGYVTGDSFRFRGTLFGGSSPLNDITISPTTISSLGVIQTVSIVTPATPPAGTGAITVSYGNIRNKMMRDASDITTRIKERIIQLESQANSPINSYVYPEIIQSNQYRLSYIYGKIKCGACSSGAFNLSGPIQRS